MQTGYSEALRRSQREGLRAAEERRLARQALRVAGGGPEPEESGAASEESAAAPVSGPGGAGEARQNGAAGAGQEMGEGGAAAPAAAAPPKRGRWSDADVVACRTCRYWQPLDEILPVMACHYPLIEGRLRPCRPADCYLHEGTPYRPIATSRRQSG